MPLFWRIEPKKVFKMNRLSEFLDFTFKRAGVSMTVPAKVYIDLLTMQGTTVRGLGGAIENLYRLKLGQEVTPVRFAGMCKTSEVRK